VYRHEGVALKVTVSFVSFPSLPFPLYETQKEDSEKPLANTNRLKAN